MALCFDDYLVEHSKTFYISTLNYHDYFEKEFANSSNDFIYPLTPEGYDIKIGYAVIREWLNDEKRYHYKAPIPLESIPDTHIDNKDDPKNQNLIIIPPKSGLVIVSLDSIYLSGWLCATVHAKSSITAKVIIMNSFTIDPHYKGRLIWYMFNSNEQSVEVTEKQTIATIVIHKVGTLTTQNPVLNSAMKVIESYKSKEDSALYKLLREYINTINEKKKRNYV